MMIEMGLIDHHDGAAAFRPGGFLNRIFELGIRNRLGIKSSNCKEAEDKKFIVHHGTRHREDCVWYGFKRANSKKALEKIESQALHFGSSSSVTYLFRMSERVPGESGNAIL